MYICVPLVIWILCGDFIDVMDDLSWNLSNGFMKFVIQFVVAIGGRFVECRVLIIHVGCDYINVFT